MKKWIAMLLSVVLLVLPFAGLADSPAELMDKAITDGLTLETLVTLEAGSLPLDESVAKPVADLVNALSLRLVKAAAGHQVFALQLDGQDALRVDTERADGVDYVASNWLGDKTLAFAEGDTEKISVRLAQLFSSVTDMNEEALQGILSGEATNDLDLSDMDVTPLTDYFTAMMNRVEIKDVTEQPSDCDPAAKVVTLTLTVDDIADFYEALFKTLRSSEKMMDLLNTYAQQASVNGESMTVEEAFDKFPAEIRALKSQFEDIPVAIYVDKADEVVKVVTSMNIQPEDGDAVKADFVLNRVSSGDIGKTYDATLTMDDTALLKITVASNLDGTSTATLVDGFALDLYDGAEASEDKLLLELAYAVEKDYREETSGKTVNAALYFRPDTTSDPLKLTLKGTDSASYLEGAATRSEEYKLYLGDETDALLTFRKSTNTVDALETLADSDAVRPGDMDDTAFQTWLNGLLTSVQSGAIKALQLLPASVLQLMMNN